MPLGRTAPGMGSAPGLDQPPVTDARRSGKLVAAARRQARKAVHILKLFADDRVGEQSQRVVCRPDLHLFPLSVMETMIYLLMDVIERSGLITVHRVYSASTNA